MEDYAEEVFNKLGLEPAYITLLTFSRPYGYS